MARSSLHGVCPHCRAVNRLPADPPAIQAKCGSCHRALFEGRPVASTAGAMTTPGIAAWVRTKQPESP